MMITGTKTILFLVFLVTVLFPATSVASITKNHDISSISSSNFDSTPSKNLRRTSLVSGGDESITIPLGSLSNENHFYRFLQTYVITEDDTCGGWFLNPEPDGNGCKVSSGGIAIIVTMVVLVVIGITIASCACCVCCPLHSSLCCADPVAVGSPGSAAGNGVANETEAQKS